MYNARLHDKTSHLTRRGNKHDAFGAGDASEVALCLEYAFVEHSGSWVPSCFFLCLRKRNRNRYV